MKYDARQLTLLLQTNAKFLPFLVTKYLVWMIISLIPNRVEADKLADFRPISL